VSEVQELNTSSEPARPALLSSGALGVLSASGPAAVTRRRRSPARWIIGAICGAGLIAAAALLTITPGEAPKAQRPLLKVERAPLRVMLHELGSIEALKETTVLSRFTGDIVWRAEDGQEVKEGDPVVRFDTKVLKEDVEAREKDLLDKRDLVRRAKDIITITEHRYQHLIRQAEIQYELAQIERKRTFDTPLPDEKQDAELTLKSAAYELEKDELELKGYDELFNQSFVSAAALKKKQLETATTRVAQARAKMIYDLTLQGYTPDIKRVAELAVADARKRLNIMKFNRDADLAVAKAGLELAEVDLGNFERELARKKRDLDWGEVKAPTQGRAVFIDVWKGSAKSRSPIQVGESRNAGGDLCVICDTSNLRIRVWINEADIEGLKTGLRAKVALPACPGKTYEAVLTELAVLAQDKNMALSNLALRKSGEAFVNVVEAKLEFTDLTQDDRNLIRVGLNAEVLIPKLDPATALSVPWPAIRYDDNNAPYAEVPATMGGRSRRNVKLGRSDTERVEVLEGLKENDQVFDETHTAQTGGDQ
jgi:multidrug efflux pump subunit AcrA (membrane-fusion protein)